MKHVSLFQPGLHSQFAAQHRCWVRGTGQLYVKQPHSYFSPLLPLCFKDPRSFHVFQQKTKPTAELWRCFHKLHAVHRAACPLTVASFKASGSFITPSSKQGTSTVRPLFLPSHSTGASEPGCQHFHFSLTHRNKTILLEINCWDPCETWGTASNTPSLKQSLEDSCTANGEQPVSRLAGAGVGVKPLWLAGTSWKQFLCCGLNFMDAGG